MPSFYQPARSLWMFQGKTWVLTAFSVHRCDHHGRLKLEHKHCFRMAGLAICVIMVRRRPRLVQNVYLYPPCLEANLPASFAASVGAQRGIGRCDVKACARIDRPLKPDAALCCLERKTRSMRNSSRLRHRQAQQHQKQQQQKDPKRCRDARQEVVLLDQSRLRYVNLGCPLTLLSPLPPRWPRRRHHFVHKRASQRYCGLTPRAWPRAS